MRPAYIIIAVFLNLISEKIIYSAENIFAAGNFVLSSQYCAESNETRVQFNNVRVREAKDRAIYFGFEIREKEKPLITKTTSFVRSISPVIYFEKDNALSFCFDTALIKKKKAKDYEFIFFLADADSGISKAEISLSPYAFIHPDQRQIARKKSIPVKLVHILEESAQKDDYHILVEKSLDIDFKINSGKYKHKVEKTAFNNLFRVSLKKADRKNLILNLRIMSFSSPDFSMQHRIHPKFATLSEIWKENTRLNPFFDYANTDLRIEADLLWDAVFTNPLEYAIQIQSWGKKTFTEIAFSGETRPIEHIFQDKKSNTLEMGRITTAMLRYKGIPARLTFGISATRSYIFVPEFFLQDTGWVFLSELCPNMVCTQTAISDYVALVRNVQEEYIPALTALKIPVEVRLGK